MKRKIKPLEVKLDDQNNVEVVEETVAEPEPVEFNYPNVALSIHKTKEGRYALVEIPYDPVTGDVGFIKVTSEDVFEDIADRFKISAAEKLLTRSNG